MNNDFQSWYLALLRKQVEDEIQFLVNNGHDQTYVNTPCMFCVEHPKGKHHCRRLKDLREFQSSIMANIRQNAKQGGRRPIGTEVKTHEIEGINMAIDNNLLSATHAPIFQLK